MKSNSESLHSSFSIKSEEYLNPYFPHHGARAGGALVRNYEQGITTIHGSRSMSMALTGKNKSGFVDGPITKPNHTDPTYIAWTCCNTMIVSWNLHSVSKEIGTIIIFIDSATKTQKDIKDKFFQSHVPRIY